MSLLIQVRPVADRHPGPVEQLGEPSAGVLMVIEHSSRRVEASHGQSMDERVRESIQHRVRVVIHHGPLIHRQAGRLEETESSGCLTGYPFHHHELVQDLRIDGRRPPQAILVEIVDGYGEQVFGGAERALDVTGVHMWGGESGPKLAPNAAETQTDRSTPLEDSWLDQPPAQKGNTFLILSSRTRLRIRQAS